MKILALLTLLASGCAMSHELPPMADGGIETDACAPLAHHCQIGACHGCGTPGAPAPFDARHVDVAGWAP